MIVIKIKLIYKISRCFKCNILIKCIYLSIMCIVVNCLYLGVIEIGNRVFGLLFCVDNW